jgi:acyl dehydratase
VDLEAVQPWTVVAQNLPEHARNPIHTDAGARAAGFPRALVAGVTTYAYMTHPPMAAWGLDWVARGGGEVRFRRPVFDGDLVRCDPTTESDGVLIEVRTDEPDQPRARLRAVPIGAERAPLRPGDPLPTKHVELSGEWGTDYGIRAGDLLATCVEAGVVHPAVWPALANHIVHANLVTGSWIHTRSIVRHHALARAGSTAEVRSVVVRRFEAHGERAVLDVEIEVEGVIVATLEHEAIVSLP